MTGPPKRWCIQCHTTETKHKNINRTESRRVLHSLPRHKKRDPNQMKKPKEKGEGWIRLPDVCVRFLKAIVGGILFSIIL